jgi:plasmid stabilization system protein ParE
MKIRILASALLDLKEGRDFYERQATGVGDYFQDSLFTDIDSLVLYGGIHGKVFGFHRVLSKRFPYAIYYRVEGESCVIVYRVLDCRREPASIRKALE